MLIQSRAIIGVLFLTSLTGRSLGQPINAGTEWEIKQVASDEASANGIGDHYINEEIVVSPMVAWVDSETHIRTGPKLKFKKDLHHARLPKWSPDGRYIAFLTICHGVRIQCLETARQDTWHRVRLTDSPKKIFKDWTSTTVNFAWSPLRDEIAYLEETLHGPSTIFLVKADGSGRKEIQRLPCHYSDELDYHDATLEWSPDGQKLAFHDCSDGIVVFDRATADNHIVARGVYPLWSPDRKMLLFRKGSFAMARGPLKGREIIVGNVLWVVNADGTQERMVLGGDFTGFGVSWLPSGKGIAFGSIRDNRNFAEIFRVNIDGTGLEKVASGAGQGLSFGSPIFSPDERQLVVVGDAGLPCLLQRALDLAVCRSADGLPARPSPVVLVIDLASGRQQKISIGNNPDVVWGRQ